MSRLPDGFKAYLREPFVVIALTVQKRRSLRQNQGCNS